MIDWLIDIDATVSLTDEWINYYKGSHFVSFIGK